MSASDDSTARLYKVAQESHLVFRGHKSPVDAVQILTDDSFVTGGQDGSLLLWREASKRPTASAALAHGRDGSSPRWITGLAALKMSDLAISGSSDGYIRLWQANAASSVLSEVASVPVDGFVNSIAITDKFFAVGTGSEHRLGRWWKLKGNKNKVQIFKNDFAE